MVEGSCSSSLKDGAPVVVHGIFRDITERKHLEEQLLQSQKMEAVGQLAGGVAHDFNNLLPAVLGYSHLAIMELPPGDGLSDYMQEIQKAGERATDLTRKLLTFSRRQMVEPRVLNLNDLILDMDKMLRHLISEDIELVTLPGPDLAMIMVDPGQMEQVLVNLAVNARDAMPDGGKLIFDTARVTFDQDYLKQHPEATAGEHVVLTVTDTGIGMTEEVKAHAFEPFFTTKEVDKGTDQARSQPAMGLWCRAEVTSQLRASLVGGPPLGYTCRALMNQPLLCRCETTQVTYPWGLKRCCWSRMSPWCDDTPPACCVSRATPCWRRPTDTRR